MKDFMEMCKQAKNLSNLIEITLHEYKDCKHNMSLKIE